MRGNVQDRRLYFQCQHCTRKYEADGDSIVLCAVQMNYWDPELESHVEGDCHIEALRLCPNCQKKISV